MMQLAPVPVSSTERNGCRVIEPGPRYAIRWINWEFDEMATQEREEPFGKIIPENIHEVKSRGCPRHQNLAKTDGRQCQTSKSKPYIHYQMTTLLQSTLDRLYLHSSMSNCLIQRLHAYMVNGWSLAFWPLLGHKGDWARKQERRWSSRGKRENKRLHTSIRRELKCVPRR
jgi:hypothetical protein